MPIASRLLLSLSLLFLLSIGNAKGLSSCGDSNKVAADTTAPKPKPQPPGFVLKPTIGVGIGDMSYWGNVKINNSYFQDPTTGKIGYDITFAQKINPHSEFDLYGLFGQLGEYARSQSYNWNFQSQISGGGFHFMYKILPQKDISPFVVIGAESFNFWSFTNQHDIYGNKYYYWSDGSIRSLPQNSPNASSAQILTPDYIYETDIRSLDLGGSGKYSEQTLAVPLGIGFMIHLTKKAEVNIGTTMHYTFTDHIDGLTPEVPEPLTGTRTHDIFFMTSFGIRYDLTPSDKLNPKSINNSRYDSIPFDVSLNNDTVHTEVSADTLPVSDSLALRQYKMYYDSTGQFAQVVYDSSTVKGGYDKPSGTRYSIEIGKYTKGVPAADMDKMLSIPDVKSTMLKDSSTIYTAGDYSDFNSAKERRDALEKQGITGTKIVYRNGNDFIETDKPVSPPGKNTGHVVTSGVQTLPPAGSLVFRVQLGAYRHKLSSTHIFSGVKNLVEVRTENGFFTYSAGSFSSYSDAALYKAQLVSEGFSDAFIKAYKDGKRITLQEAGAIYVKPEKENINDSVIGEQNTLDKNQIKFRVQIGIFKNTPPQAIKDKFRQFSNIFYEESSGTVHYYIGPYPDYASAKAMKEKALTEGIKGAFVVAFFKDKQIPVQQAISILKQ